MPRRQPVTSATLPDRSNIRVRLGVQSSRIFIDAPASMAANALRHAVERHDVGDQRVARDRAGCEQALRLPRSPRARTPVRRSASARARRRGRGRRAAARRGCRPPPAVRVPPGNRSRCHPGRRAGDLERDVRAGARRPVVDPRRGVLCRGVDRHEADSAAAISRRPAFGSKTRTSAPRERATVAISRPIGPASDDDGALPGGERRAAHVVHGDRRRLGQRRRLQREVGGQADEHRRRARSSATASTRARRCRGSSGGSRCARRRSARGAVAARDERHDGGGVPDRPALDAVADRRRRGRPSRGRAPPASTLARPSRRGGCGGRCRRSRCRRRRAAPRPAPARAGRSRRPRARRCRCSEHAFI